MPDEHTVNSDHINKLQSKDSEGFEVLRNPVTESQSKKIPEDQGDRILMKMSELFQSMETLGFEDGFSGQQLRESGERRKLQKRRTSQETRKQRPREKTGDEERRWV